MSGWGEYSISATQYPVSWTAQCTLPWQAFLFRHQLHFHGKIKPCCNYARRLFVALILYSPHHSHISTVVCSQVLIYTAECEYAALNAALHNIKKKIEQETFHTRSRNTPTSYSGTRRQIPHKAVISYVTIVNYLQHGQISGKTYPFPITEFLNGLHLHIYARESKRSNMGLHILPGR